MLINCIKKHTEFEHEIALLKLAKELAPTLPFEEAWEKWRNGPLIWGGIPSDLLEERAEQGVFEAFVDKLLATVGNSPIIIGAGDMVLDNNLIERVRYIANRVESHKI